MICTSCGATIADKAIVCYRCGAPTAIPAQPTRPAPPRSWLAVMVLVVLAATLAAVAVTIPEDSLGRLPTALGSVLSAIAAAWRALRSRRRQPRIPKPRS